MFKASDQFDKKYQTVKSGDVSALFALVTVKNFLDYGNINKKQHESNLECAALCKTIYPKTTFSDLVKFTTGSYKDYQIGTSTPELMEKNIVGYDHIFDLDIDHSYGVIFHKGREKAKGFFVVLVKNANNWTYAVRDCNMKEQRDFISFMSLQHYLNKTYRLQVIGNVQFLTMDRRFNTELEELMDEPDGMSDQGDDSS